MDEKVSVRSLYLIRDRRRLFALLDSFEWTFNKPGAVYLCFSDQRIELWYAGFGVVKNFPKLVLQTTEKTAISLEEIVKLVSPCGDSSDYDCENLSGVFIERDNESSV